MSESWFQPNTPPPSQAGPPKPGVHRIAYGEAPQQFGDLRLPDGTGPYQTVILIHGGAWQNQYHLDMGDGMADDLTARGYATWNIEYRRLGDPGAEWPGMFHDVGRAADHLRVIARQYSLDLRRVLVLGHSAGGQLALWLASRRNLPRGHELLTGDFALPIYAVIPQGSVVNMESAWRRRPQVLEQLMGGGPDQVPERYSAVSPHALVPIGVRQVLVHGSMDDRAPIEEAREYAAKARLLGDDASLVEFPGVEHFEVIYWRSPVWSRTAALVDALLRQ